MYHVGMSDQLIAYLSEQLKQRRWSQRTLAMYADISPNTVSYAMQGKTIPDPETIEKMARALNVDAYHMLRLAGHVEGPRQSIADPRVSLLAQRVDALPSDVRQRVVPALDAVIDAMVGPVAASTVLVDTAADYDALMQRAEIEADHEAGINLLMSSPEAMEEVLEEYYLLKMEQGDPEAEQMLRAVRNRRASSNAAQQQR